MVHLVEALRMTGVLLRPFLTSTPGEIFRQLGIIEESAVTWEALSTFGISSGDWKVQKGKPIFPRLDVKEEMDYILSQMRGTTPKQEEQRTKVATIEKPDVEEITIDDFAKVELRVAEVLQAEKVKKADRLLKLKLDLGFETRQVVSGIAKYYAPEELVGQKVIVVANLKPVTLRGERSEGMILAGEENGVLKVATIDPQIPNGTKIK